MKHFLLLLSLLCQFDFGNAQQNYYTTESTTLSGIQLVDGGELVNGTLCQVKKGDAVIKYTADEVKEYAFADGRVYVAASVLINAQERRVFLERLVNGKYPFYYHKNASGKYFFAQNLRGELVPLHRDGSAPYTEILQGWLSECPELQDALLAFPYSKKGFTQFGERLNTCSSKPLVQMRYGVLTGFHWSHIHIKKSATHNIHPQYVANELKGAMSLPVGLFLDLPIASGPVSTNINLMLQLTNYRGSRSLNEYDYEIHFRQVSTRLPISLRYTWGAATKYRPFVGAGACYSYHLVNANKSGAFIASGGRSAFSHYVTDRVLPTHQLSPFVSAGIQKHRNARRFIFAELRLFGASSLSYNFNHYYDTKGNELVFGWNF